MKKIIFRSRPKVTRINLFLKIEKLFAVLSFACLQKYIFLKIYREIYRHYCYRMCKTHKLIYYKKSQNIYLRICFTSFRWWNFDFLFVILFKIFWQIYHPISRQYDNVWMNILILVFYFRLYLSFNVLTINRIGTFLGSLLTLKPIPVSLSRMLTKNSAWRCLVILLTD